MNGLGLAKAAFEINAVTNAKNEAKTTCRMNFFLKSKKIRNVNS